ncbi:hypothetical protein [Frankia torreyi]|uniref:hypothetical protein n=1 Tax=Frankia torreyi TaxID=1856 RepID=UPI000FF887C2|nr:hypothetical protein [Frankia torreyi]
MHTPLHTRGEVARLVAEARSAGLGIKNVHFQPSITLPHSEKIHSEKIMGSFAFGASWIFR